MLYYVRKAKLTDLDEILKVIQDGRRTLNEARIPQWQNNEGPNRGSIGEDLSLGEGYVLIEQDKIVGYGTITKGNQAGYDDITGGEWLPSKDYVSLHRVAIHSAVRKRGKGQFFLSHLISGAVALGYTDIRIDTHPKNIRMQKVIEKSGFLYRGDILLEITDGERKAYQIII